MLCWPAKREREEHAGGLPEAHHIAQLNVGGIVEELIAIFRREDEGRYGKAQPAEHGDGPTRGAKDPGCIKPPAGHHELLIIVQQVRLIE